MGTFIERLKLVLDDKTALAPGHFTLCKLKVAKAPQVLKNLKNDRRVCVIPVEDIRIESAGASAGRSLTTIQAGRVAVPLLNPSDKERRQDRKLLMHYRPRVRCLT